MDEAKGGEGLPTFVQERVAEFRSVHEKFVHDIDAYMHFVEREDNDNEAGAVTTIIETCPEFLATKDATGALPIHRFASSSAFAQLAEVGRKHRIGGEEGRGGLLISDEKGQNTLQLLAEKQSTSVVKKLCSTNPPLLLTGP